MILIGTGLTLLVCVAAIWKGTPPERAAAASGVSATVVSLIGQALFGWTTPWPVLVADFTLAFGLLGCAVLYNRRWLYLEVVLAAGLLLAHAYLLDGEATVTPTYRAIIDSLNVAMTAILGWAVWWSWRGTVG